MLSPSGFKFVICLSDHADIFLQRKCNPYQKSICSIYCCLKMIFNKYYVNKIWIFFLDLKIWIRELTPTGMAVSGRKHCNVLQFCGTYTLNSLWEIVVNTQNAYNMTFLITQSLYSLVLIPMAFVPYEK